jgi:hypothetical protein
LFRFTLNEAEGHFKRKRREFLTDDENKSVYCMLYIVYWEKEMLVFFSSVKKFEKKEMKMKNTSAGGDLRRFILGLMAIPTLIGICLLLAWIAYNFPMK